MFAKHHVTKENGPLGESLRRHFGVSPERLHALLALGSVYLGKERLRQDTVLPAGSHLRVFLEPRRFPVSEVSWREIVVHEEDAFLVVDKPAGIPSHATDDNQLENVLSQLRQVLGKPLYITQRLDTPVGGLVVIAKTPDFQKRFNQWLASQAVQKSYRALVYKEVPVGRHVHYMEPGEKTPKQVGAEAKPGWLRCELSVVSCSARQFGEKSFFEVEILLHTGRTHQIRAQLAALGCPILGDRAYRAKVPYKRIGAGKGIALCATRIAWKDFSKELAAPWSALP